MAELKTTQDIAHIIEQDAWMMKILFLVRGLHLPDWWIGAGFVRSKVWDYLHDYQERTPLPDVDVIYFDKNNLSEEIEEKYQDTLRKSMPEVEWSVTNQARMHAFKGDKPYKSAEEGLSHWVEIPTCVGAKVTDNDEVMITAPWGVEDLLGLIVRPNPHCRDNPDSFRRRMKQKNWPGKWPKLKILYT